MKEPRAIKKQEKSALVKSVEEKVEKLIKENQIEDLGKIASIWAIMLDLEEPMLPSLAAAMMSVADIVRATTLVDAADHWQNAAVSAIMAMQADTMALLSTQQPTQKEAESIDLAAKVVGFAASVSD